jgi:hypothetical protein
MYTVRVFLIEGKIVFIMCQLTQRGARGGAVVGALRYKPEGRGIDPLYRRLGGPQDRSGRVRKISPPPGFDPPDRPARSQSLYRLSYQAHIK